MPFTYYAAERLFSHCQPIGDFALHFASLCS